MAEYKDTLNLPHTDFPMKANLPQREPAYLTQWESEQLYQQIRTAKQGHTRFILHDGPPYANGHLHCGHALNKILKDIIVKSKTMSGYDAPFVPGWDCHGLPIELNVEKKIGKAGDKVSAKDFRQACREYAQSQIDIQRDEFKRLGVFGDWENPYVTMDFSYEANIVRALAAIIDNGHLQQGFKPVHWCIDCGSALAEAEVDYEEKQSPSIDVAFYAVEPEAFIHKMDTNLAVKPVIVPIWTTTPWTLPANEAVCLHPDIQYALVDTEAAYFLVAFDLVTEVMSRYEKPFKFLRQASGKTFEQLTLRHPLYDKQVPIVLGEHVTTEAGTGAVHTAPAHGPDDYLIGKANELPLISPVLGNGCYSDQVPLFAGMSVLKSNDIIINTLIENTVLLHQSRIQHSYPHCWRHKTPVIFRATPQWFIAMDQNQLRSHLLSKIGQVKWVPDWGKARIHNMILNRPDWCISRQRAWGTPIPLFLHKETRKPHPNSVALLEKVALLIEQQGIDAWFGLETADFLGDEADNYEKSQDTLDVWFDSGVTHFAVLKQQSNLAFPADVYFEGSDQHRGWFNSSLTTAVAMYNEAPYKTVLTHGYTVDAEGKKLSKSKGNYVSLDKLIKQYGADVLRLWVSSTDYRNEVSISEEIMKRTSDAYRRIRNTARFLLANLFDFQPQDILKPEAMIELDRWAIARCQQLQDDVLKAYEQYQFHIIYQKIHNFCAVDMGSFYLDIIKDRQYTTSVNSLARRSCQTAMYYIVQAFARMLAPILSFTAEEIWQSIPGYDGQSIFLQEWYTAWPMVHDVDMNYWQKMQSIRDEVNKALENARQAGEIGSGLAAEVIVYADSSTYDLLNRLDEELRFVFITSAAQVMPIKHCPQAIPRNTELGIAIEVKPSSFAKCSRCWHRRPDVGSFSDHPELCGRCIGNITGIDESRQFA